MGFFQSTPPNADHQPITIINVKHTNGGARRWSWTWRDPFQICTTFLLSLLLPLSFLLLARLSAVHYYIVANSSSSSSSFLVLYTTQSLLFYILTSFVSVAAFVHGLTTSPVLLTFVSSPEPPTSRLPSTLYLAWVLLCTFQVCVGLGVEGTILAGIDGSGFGRERSFLVKALLFVGLHETMLFWTKFVVKPVVADTVRGSSWNEIFIDDINGRLEEIRWVAERAGIAVSFGTLWWWRLRDEVDSLVVVAEILMQSQHVGAADFVGWWLYYLTVSIGTIRVLKGVIWVVSTTTRRHHYWKPQNHHPAASINHLPLDQDLV